MAAPELRTGYTTGACAAAGAKAALLALLEEREVTDVTITLPGGDTALIPVEDINVQGTTATAEVIKDAGDDPDVTNGMRVVTQVALTDDDGLTFHAGPGVGTVTRKGLQVKPGGPAINPGPRRMITDAVRSVTDKGVAVTVSIPGGERVAQKTFNPRLGIEGGLSVLGTTGIVRPYSHPAVQESLKCTLDVALAGGVARPVFTAGNIGTRAALEALGAEKQSVIEVSNEWGFMLDQLKEKEKRVEALLAVGHPGKLAKLPNGDFDTHSSRSASALPYVLEQCRKITGHAVADANTVEEVFRSLPPVDAATFGNALAADVAAAIQKRLENTIPVAVALVDMKGSVTGTSGRVEEWKNR